VAMHNQVAVRVSDRPEYIEKELDARFNIQLASVAVLIDLLSIHIFENQIWLSVGGDAGIDQLSDIRMRKLTKNLTFLAKPLLNCAGSQSEFKELDGDAPFETSVTSLRKPNNTHSPLPDRRNKLVRTQGSPCLR